MGSRRKLQFETFEREQPCSSYDLLSSGCGSSTSVQLKQWAKIQRLAANCKLYQLIEAYVNNSKDSCITMAIKRIFKVIRHQERDPFDSKYRIMLWHGTKPQFIPGIIEHGLIPSKGSQWFGNGVYFADRMGMSAGYAGRSATTGTSFFILAEVSPGKVYKAHHIHSEYGAQAPPGFNSVKGMGSQIPDWKGNADYFGAIMPIGKSITNSRHPTYDIPYSEYVIYDPDRIIIRFIVECSM